MIKMSSAINLAKTSAALAICDPFPAIDAFHREMDAPKARRQALRAPIAKVKLMTELVTFSNTKWREQKRYRPALASGTSQSATRDPVPLSRRTGTSDYGGMALRGEIAGAARHRPRDGGQGGFPELSTIECDTPAFALSYFAPGARNQGVAVGSVFRKFRRPSAIL